MQTLFDVQKSLEPKHRDALAWFESHTGKTSGWPQPLADGTILATRAKGIYKPEWSKYALSVRQNMGGPYPDRDPVVRADGTWVYQYFQELNEPERRDESYGNVGLIECMKDRVPVGVLRQVQKKPDSLYQVLGLAFVANWDGGYFFLEGFNAKGMARETVGSLSEIDVLSSRAESLAGEIFDASSTIDAREKIVRSIVQRRGQVEFRRKLLSAYGGRCAVTGCSLTEVLDAAHIVPYKGEHTNHPANGLLLRTDIHNLFDIGLIAIEPIGFTVIISPKLTGSDYSAVAGKKILLPDREDERPSTDALARHREWSRL